MLICTQLPCGHKFCKKCIEEWEKQRGADKACPLCRNPLPPGPEKLFDLGYGMYMKIRGGVDRSRPGVAKSCATVVMFHRFLIIGKNFLNKILCDSCNVS